MHRSDWKSVLAVAAPAALAHLESLPDRRVHPAAAYADVRAALDHGLPETGLDSTQVVRDLVRDLGPYVTAHARGRFFGFVIGGLHPAAWGAELLVSTWDQNAGLGRGNGVLQRHDLPRRAPDADLGLGLGDR